MWVHWGLGQFADSKGGGRGGLAKKRGGDTPMHADFLLEYGINFPG